MSLFPAPSYSKCVLEPIFEHMKHNMYLSMTELNDSHAIMLMEQGLISEAECKSIINALHDISEEGIRNSVYDGSVEDLFFFIEHKITAAIGEEVAGKLATARSRNDMDLTIYRMILREKILSLVTQMHHLQETFIALIDEHKDTVMTGYTHTQPAQATTFGHYLLAQLDVTQRDGERFVALYGRVNRSPMGAAAFTTTGFPINRDRVRELLGFDSLVENSYDAIAGGDYITEAASVLALFAVNMGRFVQDLLQWATVEFGSIRVGDAFVQISSIMPQKRNHVSLEHSRALFSAVYGEAMAVISMVHNTPFGDIVDTEDDLQPHLWNAYDRASNVICLMSEVLRTIQVNKAMLKERVKQNFSTVTELADTLVRNYGLSFRTAHHIVSKVSKECYANGWSAEKITVEMIEKAHFDVTGNRKEYDASILDSLDPDQFVRLRSIKGGPAPSEVSRMVKQRSTSIMNQYEWLVSERSFIDESTMKRNSIVASLIGRKEHL